MGGVTKINTDSPVTEVAVARWELSLKYKSKLCASIYWILSSCSPKFRTIRVCQHHISRRQDFAPNEHQPPTVYCLQQTLKLYYPGIFSCKNYCCLIQVSPKFVPMRPIWNKPSLVQIMGWRQTGANLLPESMLVLFIDANAWFAVNEFTDSCNDMKNQIRL